ncbi:MAG TPA: flagellar hook-associated protein FlgK, partial [Candidatus Wallbacteria bacterium]|nr:flagellar hook-associated protein FlgK [Candidatus Wallbacteria bacterium]
MAISSFSLFESAKKGLSANQIALTVVSQNVANASTEGYTRQEVLFKNSSPSTYANNITDAIGTGVDVGEIRQIRDTYIEAQLRLQNDTNSYWSASKSYLERIQTFLTDNSDAGIRGLMDKFWKAAEDVSNSAQSQTNRLSIIQAGEAFTSGIKYVAAQIDEVKNSADGAIGEKISQLNDLAKRVAEINSQISKFERADLKMNDLRDERAR